MWKIYGIILIYVVTLSEILASDDIAVPVLLSSADATEDNELPSCDGIYGIRCADCSRLQVCANKTIGIHNCRDLNSNTPYCTQQVCTSTPSEKCKGEVPSSSFICTDTGLFPNTKNCSRFFLCGAVGKPPNEYECPYPFVYSSKDGSCKRRIYSTDCVTIDCSRSPNKFLVYPADKSILAYCEPNAEFPLLTRCPDSSNQEYDPNTLECNFVCRSEGRFPDALDCKSYYQCLRNGYVFIQMHINCDPLNYNPISGQCELTSNGQCKNAITTTPNPNTI